MFQTLCVLCAAYEMMIKLYESNQWPNSEDREHTDFIPSNQAHQSISVRNLQSIRSCCRFATHQHPPMVEVDPSDRGSPLE